MFPMATAAGNTMVLKPSERDPGASMMLAELAAEAGASLAAAWWGEPAESELRARPSLPHAPARQPLHPPPPRVRAGLPKGVLNIVHGTHDTVNRILDHPDISAVAFVGSNAAGRHIYSRGCANGKRVQANMVRAWLCVSACALAGFGSVLACLHCPRHRPP